MIVGYARTSTVDQVNGYDAQLEELKREGCEKIFGEQVSSVAQRAELDRALEFIREGDVLMVTKLDRLARSVADLCAIEKHIASKGAALRVNNMKMDTSTPTGKLMLNVLGSIAQFEREIMLERQREGIARAKAEGLYKGRKPTAQQHKDTVIALHKRGMGVAGILKEIRSMEDKDGNLYEIGQTSVYQIIADYRKQSEVVAAQ
jgi:DNA invertase Pin-like site-specific DNA recombinase